MAVLTEPTAVFAQFGEALAYPRPALGGVLATLRDSVGATGNSAAEKLEVFVRFASQTPAQRMEEHYIRAFDLAPIAVPYLSVYLFGAENPQRGQFMACLMEAYAKVGHDCEGELPDHLSLLLRYAPKAPPGEWDEICDLCLPAPLRLMHHALAGAGNPYAELVDALRSFTIEFGENRDV